jgi:hypothetical protein
MGAGARKPPVPSVLFQGRLPAETDKLRRQIQEKLDLSASQLLARAIAALARELDQAGQPAE